MNEFERKAASGGRGVKRSQMPFLRRNKQAVAVAAMIVVFIGYNWFMFSKHVQIKGELARSNANVLSSVLETLVSNTGPFDAHTTTDDDDAEDGPRIATELNVEEETAEPGEDVNLPIILQDANDFRDDEGKSGSEETVPEKVEDVATQTCDKEFRCAQVSKFPTNFSSGEASTYACGFDVYFHTEYLPDAKFYKCIQANKPKDWMKEKSQMIAKIEALQMPADCNAPESKVRNKPLWKPGLDEHGNEMRVGYGGHRPFPLPRGKPKWALLGFLNHGYAYNLYVFTWLAGNYWAQDGSVIVGNSKYRFSDVKCGKSWSCLWTPLTKCKLQDINREQVLVFHGAAASWRDVMTLDQVCQPRGRYSMSTGRCQCEKGFLPSRNSSYRGCAPYTSLDLNIPRIKDHVETWEKEDEKLQASIRDGDELYFAGLAPFESNPHGNANRMHDFVSPTRKKYGFIWEHAHWLWYLHRGAPKRKELDKFLQQVGLRPNSKQHSVGVHVRHGDSCHDIYQTHRVCLPLSAYMKGVKKLEGLYGKFDVIYLATDDPKVIKDTQLPEYKTYKFIYQGIDRTMYETDDHNGVDIREEFNEPDIVMEIARDIWALAHCSSFVGSFASSVAWVAYELSAARNGHYTPFVSVDMPFAHRKNIGRFLNGPNM